MTKKKLDISQIQMFTNSEKHFCLKFTFACILPFCVDEMAESNENANLGRQKKKLHKHVDNKLGEINSSHVKIFRCV